jgi:hypothetical protein
VLCALIVFVGATFGSLEPARAQSAAAETHWGWAIVSGSLLVGGALTMLGLQVDCGPADTECHRRASLAIWGGVGVASVGSICGLTLVHWGEDARRPARAPRRYALELGPARTHGEGASLGSGLVLRLRAP